MFPPKLSLCTIVLPPHCLVALNLKPIPSLLVIGEVGYRLHGVCKNSLSDRFEVASPFLVGRVYQAVMGSVVDTGLALPIKV